jgi:hypothetical protein
MSQFPIYRHLTDDNLPADGTNQDASVNGVVTPQHFYIAPAADEKFALYRLLVVIEYSGVPAADKYGSIATLANGVSLDIRSGSNPATANVLLDLMDGTDVQSNIDWTRHCYDVTDHSFGAGNNYTAVRWTFANSGRPIVLRGHNKNMLCVTVNDDLSTLVSHEFQVQGHLIDSIGSHQLTWGA